MDNNDSQQEENEVWFPTPQLQEEREQLLTTGARISPESKSEPFSFQKNTFEKGLALSRVEDPLFDFEVSERNQSDLKLKREKTSLSTTRECVIKWHRPEDAEQEETNALSHPSNLCTSQTVEDDCNYTCPLGSDEATDSENNDNRDNLKTSDLDTCSTGFSQAPVKTPNLGSFTDIEQGNEANVLLWTLRETQIRQNLTVPHGEHCPLYTYSRCKTLGIDFNVGSGVKQNLDPSKFLTNGIMLEINSLAAALGSAQKEFITEILEYNFHLNFNNELCRTVFTQHVLEKIRLSALKKIRGRNLKMPFELPDSRVIDESTYPKANYCSKCYQDRNSKRCQDESDHDHLRHPHPHSMTDTVSSATNCLAQKPEKDLSAAFQAAEETIMDSYRLCKKIGLSLCVDRDKPKVKLDNSTLTRGVMKEIVHFAKRLCGTKNKLINDVLEHNFNFGIFQRQNFNPALWFHQMVGRPHYKGPTWCNDIFLVFPKPYRESTDVVKQSENQVWFPTPQLQEESKQLLTAGTKISPEFKSEPFSFQKNTFEKGLALSHVEVPLFDFRLSKRNQSDLKLKREKRSLSTTRERVTKRHRPEEAEQEETNALSHPSNLCTSQTVEDDYNYMCPLDSDEATDSENDDNKYDLKNSNLDTCSTSFSQAPIKTPNVRSSTHIEQGNEANVLLWTLRETQIQQILSVPHVEHCPLYSYSRCKKLGIDFNVGSGVKQNLDPSKFLTNGIMVEINSLAAALGSAQKEFITEILEYNFHLNLNNEVCRSVFAEHILEKIRTSALKKNKGRTLKMPFELPDTSSIDQSTHPKGKYCPKCYQDRNSKLFQDASDPVNELHHHPHSMTDAVFAEANCSAQKLPKDPSLVFHAVEEKIMNSYPRCKKIGLSLCVYKDKPKSKLDLHVLTRGVMRDIAFFATKLCGTKFQLMKDVLKHNFNIDIQCQDLYKVALLNKDPACFNDIFVFELYPYKGHRDVTKWKEDSAIQKNERKEMTKKRKLALLTKKEGTAMLREYTGAVKTKECKQSSEDYPICKGIVLDLDLENPTSTDIHSESEPSCLGNHQPFLPTTDGLSSLPTVKLNVNPSFVSQSNERVLFGTEEKPEIQQNVSYRFDMEEQEMETESNMWKLRANCVQQIFFSLDKEYCTLKRSKKLGLEYNVGFGPKQNFSGDSLTTSMLLEIAKFALAMNSSQEYFIMEILEYNFDHWSEDQKKSFAPELMDSVRWLKNCEDAVKLSKEVFELPSLVSSINMVNQSMGIVNPEFSSMTSATECDVVPTCSSDPHAETQEHKVDLYPFCKDIGLKLNVLSNQENKKLDINKLTNGAMTEVTNFAEKLCGTFDQICLDILRHNFDLEGPDGDSDLAKMILAQIPVIMKQKCLASFMSASRKKYTITDSSAMAMVCQKNPNLDSHFHKNLTGSEEIKHTIRDLPSMKKDCQNNSNLDTCSTGFSQAPIRSQTVGSSTHIEQGNELDLLLWTLRETQIQQILSFPHVEHCPFYSYSRCKKLGVDFNVASGVKQNLDPSEFLTNGIMVEISTLAAALESAQKEFITEILEYNFHLNLNNEVFRSVFAQHVFDKVRALAHKCKTSVILKMPFELPDASSIDQSTYAKGKYCPKCYQDRNSKFVRDPSDPLNELRHHPHSMTDAVFAEANCSAQKPTKDLSIAFQAAEEKIMNSYPLCKKIGLSLCVHKDKPKSKLNLHVLTRGVIKEVAHFTKRLCGAKNQLTKDVLEHNFNIYIQNQGLNPVELLQRMALLYNGPTWFNDIFVIQPLSYKSRKDVRKSKEDSAVQKNERKEAIEKRKLALLTKKEEAAMLTDLSGAVKVRTRKLTSAEIFPLCSKMGLDLDVTLKSGKKKKLDLKLLTAAVVVEINKFLRMKHRHYYPDSLYDILDYNFDISSQNYRRWEFTMAAASKVKNLAKTYQKNLQRANEVFKLPFVFEKKASKGSIQERQNQKNSKVCVEKETNGEGRAAPKLKRHLDLSHACLDDVQTNMEVWFHEDIKSQTYPETIKQLTESPVSGELFAVQENKRKETIKKRQLALQTKKEHLHRVNKVLKMPSVIEDEAHIKSVQERQNKKTGKSHQKKNPVQHLSVRHADFLDVNMYKELWMGRGMASPKHPGTIMQVTKSPGRSICDSPLQEDLQIKEDEDDSYYAVVKPEPVTSPEADMATKAPQQLKCCSDVSAALVDVQTNTEVWFHEEDIKPQTYPDTMKQLRGSPVSRVCDGPLQENVQIKEDADESYHVAVKSEPVTEGTSEPMGSLGSNLLTICPPPESKIKTESGEVDVQYYSLAGPQVTERYGVLAVCPNTDDVMYEILVESAESQGFSKITTHQDTDSTSVKTEQENVPVVSDHFDVV